MHRCRYVFLFSFSLLTWYSLKSIFPKLLPLFLLQFSTHRCLLFNNNCSSCLFGAIATTIDSYYMSSSERFSTCMASLLALLSSLGLHFLCFHQRTESLCNEINAVEFISVLSPYF